MRQGKRRAAALRGAETRRQRRAERLAAAREACSEAGQRQHQEAVEAGLRETTHLVAAVRGMAKSAGPCEWGAGGVKHKDVVGAYSIVGAVAPERLG